MRPLVAFALGATLLHGGAALGCDLTHTETAGLVVAEALIEIDREQTVTFLSENPKRGSYELNPVVGRRPTRERLNTLVAGGMLGTLEVACALSGWQRALFLGVVITVEAQVIHWNQRKAVSHPPVRLLGIRLPF